MKIRTILVAATIAASAAIGTAAPAQAAPLPAPCSFFTDGGDVIVHTGHRASVTVTTHDRKHRQHRVTIRTSKRGYATTYVGAITDISVNVGQRGCTFDAA